MVIRKIVPTAMIVACAGAPVGAPSVAQAQEVGFIEVTGTGSITLEADRAQVSFAVETRLPVAAVAAATNADTMAGVLSALRSSGFGGLSLATFGYSLRPEYSRPGPDRSGPPTIDGYTAVNNIRATISDIESVGALIDLAIQSGANRISSVTFSASDTRAARAEALTTAVEDARAKASAIASALGRALGGALEVRGGAQQPSQRMGMVSLELRASTPVEPADQVVRADVTVRFALGPGDSPR